MVGPTNRQRKRRFAIQTIETYMKTFYEHQSQEKILAIPETSSNKGTQTTCSTKRRAAGASRWWPGYQGGGPERKACKRCWASCTSRSVAAAISAADMTSGAGDRGAEWAGDGLAVLARRTERDPRRDAGADAWPQNGFQTCSGSSQSLLSDEPGDVWQPDPGPLAGRLATPRGELDSEVRRGAMGTSGTWSGWKTASCSFKTRLATVGDRKNSEL